jgi:hypothetical protein
MNRQDAKDAKRERRKKKRDYLFSLPFLASLAVPKLSEPLRPGGRRNLRTGRMRFY